MEEIEEFFRSLIVALVALAFVFASTRGEESYGLIATCVVLLLLALWRYTNQRRKARDSLRTHTRAISPGSIILSFSRRSRT